MRRKLAGVDKSGWVDETLPLRVLHRARVSMWAGVRVSGASEPGVHGFPSSRIARRPVASAGVFAIAVAAVLGGSVGVAAAAPTAAPHSAKSTAGTTTAGPSAAPNQTDPSTQAASTRAAPASSSTSAKSPKGGQAGTAAAPTAASGGTLCDSSGSGEAIFANVTPTPAFDEGQPTGGGIVASGTTLSATYFDEAGFHTTGTISGPFTTKPGSSSYPLTPTISTLPVTPATSPGAKSGVQISATVPRFTAPVAANTWYALTISVADNDDKVPAPCTVQWLVSATPPPAPAPTPTPAPTSAPSALTPPPPTVQITKLNNAAGTGYGVSETAAPGSKSVPYRVTVTNPNASPGTLTVLTDTIGGVTTNLCPSLSGTVLAASGRPNDSVTCNFTGPVPSTPTVDTAGTTLSVNGVLASATARSTVFPPVLGTQVVPPPSAPAALAFTGAPVGKMLAAGLGMIALGLALLAGLRLIEGERRPWPELSLALCWPAYRRPVGPRNRGGRRWAPAGPVTNRCERDRRTAGTGGRVHPGWLDPPAGSGPRLRLQRGTPGGTALSGGVWRQIPHPRPVESHLDSWPGRNFWSYLCSAVSSVGFHTQRPPDIRPPFGSRWRRRRVA